MVINLWYNPQLKLWRWSLTEINLLEQRSGGQPELRSALDDVATTVEYILDKESKGE